MSINIIFFQASIKFMHFIETKGRTIYFIERFEARFYQKRKNTRIFLRKKKINITQIKCRDLIMIITNSLFIK